MRLTAELGLDLRRPWSSDIDKGDLASLIERKRNWITFKAGRHATADAYLLDTRGNRMRKRIVGRVCSCKAKLVLPR